MLPDGVLADGIDTCRTYPPQGVFVSHSERLLAPPDSYRAGSSLNHPLKSVAKFILVECGESKALFWNLLSVCGARTMKPIVKRWVIHPWVSQADMVRYLILNNF